jgi:hypothetical protein
MPKVHVVDQEIEVSASQLGFVMDDNSKWEVLK